MRYTLDSMLPIGAFEHCGNRHIKLYGGGGSWNPVTIVEDAVTSVGDAVAPVVEGISDAGVAIDEGVNDAVPGGWATVGVVAAAIAAPYLAPELFALGEGALATEGAAGLTGGGAFVPAAGSGASFIIPEGVAYTAGAAGAGGAGGALTTGEILGSGGFTAAEGSGASFAIPEGAAYGAGGTGALAGPTYGELGYTGLAEGAAGPTYGELGYTGLNNAEAIAAANAAAAPGAGLMGPTYGELGYTGVPEGGMGPTYAEMGYTGLNNAEAIAAADAAAKTGLTAGEVFDAANKARRAYNLINNLTAGQTGSRALLRPSTGLPQGVQQDSSSQAGGSVVGALPGNLKETSLAAAPVMQGTNMNINQLKQLYPQLSTVDPRIVQMLTGKSSNVPNYFNYGSEQSGSTGLSAQGQGGLPSPGSPGYPSIAADRTSGQSALAGTTPTGPFDALSSAGLRALNTGALPGMTSYGLKDGGSPEHQEGEHIPEFITGKTGHFVEGRGDGQSDDIPAMLADGEYVFDADTVASLGNGSSKAGALQLDKMRQAIRKHKRAASHDKIPPKAKSPLEYLKGK